MAAYAGRNERKKAMQGRTTSGNRKRKGKKL
jgi:hypothetical protein